jgi:hypothetical protein
MQDDHSRTISDIFESLEHDRTLGDSVFGGTETVAQSQAPSPLAEVSRLSFLLQQPIGGLPRTDWHSGSLTLWQRRQ